MYVVLVYQSVLTYFQLSHPRAVHVRLVRQNQRCRKLACDLSRFLVVIAYCLHDAGCVRIIHTLFYKQRIGKYGSAVGMVLAIDAIAEVVEKTRYFAYFNLLFVAAHRGEYFFHSLTNYGNVPETVFGVAHGVQLIVRAVQQRFYFPVFF